MAVIGEGRKTRTAILSAFFYSGTTVGALSSRLGEIKDAIGASNVSYGTAFSFNALGALLGYFLGARGIKRFGSHRIAIVILCLISPLNIAYSLISNTHQLAILALLGGCFYAIFYISVNNQAVLFEGKAGRSFLPRAHGLWSFGALSGSFVASVLSNFLNVFQILLTINLGLLLIWSKNSRNLIKTHDHGAVNSYSFKILKDRTLLTTLLTIAIAQAIAMVAEGSANDWSAVLLHENIGVSVTLSGYGFVIFALVQMVSRFFAPKFVDRYSLSRVVAIAGTTGSIGFIFFHNIAIHSDSHRMLLSCISFAFLSFGVANLVPAFASTSGNFSGISSASILMFIGILGAVFLWLGRLLFAFSANYWSLPNTMTLVAAILLLSVFTAQQVSRNKKE